jgi:hypothetical protein
VGELVSSGFDWFYNFFLKKMGLRQGKQFQRENKGVITAVWIYTFDGMDSSGLDKGHIA